MAKGRNVNLDTIVASIVELDKDDFQTVMCTVAKINPHPEIASYITNKWQQARKMEKITVKKDSPVEHAVQPEFKLFEKPKTPQRKPGRDGSRVTESSLVASLPDIHGISAWKVPILFRGDLVPKNGKLYLDVEKLSMKHYWGFNADRQRSAKKSHRQVANNIALVDEKGTLIFWAFIRRNIPDVCRFCTALHRIDKSKLITGVEIETVREILEKCLNGNTLVGTKVKDDLASLSLKNEFSVDSYFNHSSLIDLQQFFHDGRDPYKLKDLVAHFFPNKARTFQSEFHSSISDARITLQLYLKMCELKNANKDMINTSKLNIKRGKSEKYNFKGDCCRCLK